MGPIVILDKSALQSLSLEEADFLFKHYYVNIPPILVIEILGDLKKFAGDKARSEAEVRKITEKLRGMDSKVNAPYKMLVEGSLLGYPVEMEGRIHILGGTPVVDSRGEKGVFIDEAPEEIALRRWGNEEFTGTEELLAERWREVSKGFDIEGFKRQLKKVYKLTKRIDSYDELIRIVDSILGAAYQSLYVKWAIDDFGLPSAIEKVVFDRWRKGRFRAFKEFAPYAYYCFRISLAFKIGLANDLIGTRPTNRIDMEYLFYLPFCMVFSSADAFQSAFCQAILGEECDFVGANVLKADLKRIATHWKGLTEEQKSEYAYDYGSYPPQDQESFTCQIWKKHMKPWTPGSGNRATKMTKEEEQRILEYLRPEMEAIEKLKRNRHG